MNVLSLFDGISCGMVALERAGIPVDRYVAYEIDESAIKVSKANYPNIEHCGDVTAADFHEYKGFDLLIGGSPCQSLSIVQSKTREHLDGKSKLFYEYLRAKEEMNPKYKMHTLTCVSGGGQQKKVYVDGRVRKLTPIEYERLQTLPDNYTAGLSDGKRYTCCGNGWTVNVIAHIVKGIV